MKLSITLLKNKLSELFAISLLFLLEILLVLGLVIFLEELRCVILWEQTNAEVIDCENIWRRRRRGRLSASLNETYIYHVNGMLYTGNTSGRESSDKDTRGEIIKIYYDPKNPANNCQFSLLIMWLALPILSLLVLGGVATIWDMLKQFLGLKK